MKKCYLSVLVLSVFLLSSCLNTDDSTECNRSVNLNVDEIQLAADIELIEEYLTDRPFETEEHPSGLRYRITEPGTGEAITLCDNVSVTYTGKLISNDEVFDSATEPVRFPLSNLIRGWQIGLPLIREGGEIELFIPSVYGYGQQGFADVIPPNANLRFRINVQ